MKTTLQGTEAQGKCSTWAAGPETSADNGDDDEVVWFDVDSLYHHFERLTDKRKKQGLQYPLAMVLTCALLAKLAGENTPAGIADWVRLRGDELAAALKLTRRVDRRRGQQKMPCASSYGRILGTVLQVRELERMAHDYFELSQPGEEGQVGAAWRVQLCLDGKKIRGTITALRPNGVYMLAAYLPGQGVVLMQMVIEAGQGELTVAPKLLKVLDLQGKVVTGDAEFTQRNLSIQVVQAGGHYLWKVKDNQPTLLADIQQVFAPQSAPPPGFNTPPTDCLVAEQHSTGHGRDEHRTLTASSLLKGYSDWPHLAQVFRYDCSILDKQTGQRTVTVSYGVTSLSAAEAPPADLLRLVRGHWQIENGLHYRRDVTLGEDFCNLSHGTLCHAMAVLNNLVIGLSARSGAPNLPSARRRFDAHPDQALRLILRA